MKFGLVSTLYREIFAHVLSPISPPLSTGESKTGRIQFLNLFLFKQNGRGGRLQVKKGVNNTGENYPVHSIHIYMYDIALHVRILGFLSCDFHLSRVRLNGRTNNDTVRII